MAKNDGAAADTTIMGIVHDGLRRDLVRLRTTLTTDMVSSTAAERGRAVGTHVIWMMNFLHHHHQGEDEGLWPLLLTRAPQSRALLERMESDHRRIIPAMTAVEAAGSRYRDDGDGEARIALVEALDRLSEALLPHLRREEDEAMPLASATITRAEWNAWDHKYNVKGKSLSRLAMEGHWLSDGLDQERYQVLMHLVPAPVRVVHRQGFRPAVPHRVHPAMGA